MGIREKTAGHTKEGVKNGEPRSLAIANQGIKTSNDFSNLMSALMSDLIEGKVAASVGNATCNAGGKLLKMVDMTYKYGSPAGNASPKKTLTIAFEEKKGISETEAVKVKFQPTQSTED